MVDLEDLQSFGSSPPLPPTPVDRLMSRVERRRHRRWAACALLAAAALLTAGVTLATRGHEEQRTAGTTEESAAARALLLTLADQSEAQPSLTTDADPILHSVAEREGTSSVVSLNEQREEEQAVIVDTNREENWWLTPTWVRSIGRLIGDRRPLNDTAVSYLATQPPMPEIAYRGLMVERDTTRCPFRRTMASPVNEPV